MIATSDVFARANTQALRRVSVDLLDSKRHPGAFDVNIPSADELINGLSAREAIERIRANRGASFEALKQTMRIEKELAKQKNVEALSDFFRQLINGTYVEEIPDQTRKRKPYRRRAPSSASSSSKVPRLRDSEEVLPEKPPVMPYGQYPFAPGPGFYPAQPVVAGQNGYHPPNGFYMPPPMPYGQFFYMPSTPSMPSTSSMSPMPSTSHPMTPQLIPQVQNGSSAPQQMLYLNGQYFMPVPQGFLNFAPPTETSKVEPVKAASSEPPQRTPEAKQAQKETPTVPVQKTLEDDDDYSFPTFHFTSEDFSEFLSY